MSEALDQETARFSRNMEKLLEEVCRIAEATRLLGIDEPRFRGGEIANHSAGTLVVAVRELKPGYFLALFYDTTEVLTPDPLTRVGLKDCLAWILKYDSQHARWSVEAWNESIGNRSFSKLVRSLETFPRLSSTSMVLS